MLAAVIFDFDGIIVDTEPLHYRAFQMVLEPLGFSYSWDEYVNCYMGFDDRDAFKESFRRAGRILAQNDLETVIRQKADAFQEVIASGVPSYPGVVELIRELSGRLPLAICSGALHSDIAPILRQLGVDSCFDVIVTADDVTASKPDPASYALAVTKLGRRFADLSDIGPANCLAIEDTPAGIASARGAGLPVLAVTNSYPADMLAGAVQTVNSLQGFNLEELKRLV